LTILYVFDHICRRSEFFIQGICQLSGNRLNNFSFLREQFSMQVVCK